MMSKPFPPWTLLIPLFMLVIGALAGPCMPCQTQNKRHTPWDHRLPVRGLHSMKITNPTNKTEWNTGSDVVVTWNFRDKADQTTDAKGTLLLGYLEDGHDNEHLNITHPLTSNFDLRNEFVTFKCPDVDPRKNYIVVLLGDSGNVSPPFTINKQQS